MAKAWVAWVWPGAKIPQHIQQRVDRSIPWHELSTHFQTEEQEEKERWVLACVPEALWDDASSSGQVWLGDNVAVAYVCGPQQVTALRTVAVRYDPHRGPPDAWTPNVRHPWDLAPVRVTSLQRRARPAWCMIAENPWRHYSLWAAERANVVSPTLLATAVSTDHEACLRSRLLEQQQPSRALEEAWTLHEANPEDLRPLLSLWKYFLDERDYEAAWRLVQRAHVAFEYMASSGWPFTAWVGDISLYRLTSEPWMRALTGFYHAPQQGASAARSLERGRVQLSRFLPTRLWYLRQFPLTAQWLDWTCPPAVAHMIPSNTCLFLRRSGQWSALVRTISYRLGEDGSYTLPVGVVDSRAWWMEGPAPVDGMTWTARPATWVQDLHIAKRLATVRGMEDVRLFETPEGRLGYLATNVDLLADAHRPLQYIGWFENGALLPPHLLQYQTHLCQKNWLPFCSDGRVLAIYSTDPLVLVEMDPETGQVKEHLRRPRTGVLSQARGTAAPVQTPRGGWLWMVHEVWHWEGHRYYVLRCVEADREWNLVRWTQPWTVYPLEVGRGHIEYTLGFAPEWAQDGTLSSISMVVTHNDADPKLVRIHSEALASRWMTPEDQIDDP